MIDAVHLDIDDHDGLAEEAADAAALGFGATACIHPSQVPVVRAAYRPTDAQVRWATTVLEAVHGSAGAVAAVEGMMVDGPIIRQAEVILRRAQCSI